MKRLCLGAVAALAAGVASATWQVNDDTNPTIISDTDGVWNIKVVVYGDEANKELCITAGTKANPDSQNGTAITAGSGVLDLTDFYADTGWKVTALGKSSFRCGSKCAGLIAPDVTVLTAGGYQFYEQMGNTKKIHLSSNLKSIGPYAFYSCTALSDFLPTNCPSVTSIGNSAFRNCNAMAGDFSFPNVTGAVGKGAFGNCYKITSLSLPNITGDVGDDGETGAFQSLTACKFLNIGPGVTKFTRKACYNTTKAEFVNKDFPLCTNIGTYAFNSCAALTGIVNFESLVIIENDQAFKGSGITGIVAPKLVTIGSNAFNGCPLEGEISLPSATKLGASAFTGCSKITSIFAPNAIDLGSDCIRTLASLQSVTLSANLTSLGNCAFRDVPKLTTLVPTRFVSSTILAVNGFYGVAALTGDFEFPNLEKVDTCMFYNCSKITSVSLPAATNIAASAFQGDAAITNVVLSPNLRTIGTSAFNGCAKLGKVEPFLPEGIESIGESAFQGAVISNALVIKSEKLTTIGANAFYNAAKFMPSVDIDAPLTSIGGYAFLYETAKTTNFFHNAVAPTTIGDSAYYNYGTPNILLVTNAKAVPGWEALCAPNAELFEAAKKRADFPGDNTIGVFRNGKFNGGDSNFYHYVVKCLPPAGTVMMLM